MEKDLDGLKNCIKEALLSQTPPKVVHNPKNNKISVQYDFALGRIKKVKLIASTEEWLKFFYELDLGYELNTDIDASPDDIISDVQRWLAGEIPQKHFSFDDFKPYFYFTQFEKNKIAALKRYAQEHPDHFSSDIFNCVLSALDENPLFKPRRKPRKPSKYGLTPWYKNIISWHAAQLYVYLLYISKLEKPLPYFLSRYLEFTEANDGEGRIDIETQLGRQHAVRRMLSVFYETKFSERFFQTFVTDSNIKLNRIKSVFPNTPEQNPFLKPLFQEFI